MHSRCALGIRARGQGRKTVKLGERMKLDAATSPDPDYAAFIPVIRSHSRPQNCNNF